MRHALILTLSLFLLLTACGPEEARVSFNADVRPIFNAKCVRCHGGVKQGGELGLIFRENAMNVIVPGHPGRSELIRRVRHTDPELRMPYESAPLTEAEITTLERWIEQGAEWEEHWAFRAPEPTDPELAVPAGGNEIDAFVAKRLRAQGIDPAPAAAPHTLLRRLSLDLTGLPPAPDLMDEWLTDPSEATYARMVDTFLASPRYGEHRAATWLDLARYADSRGYERDRPRTIWPYRDWVIRAFNADMPFDQFTIEQLAGDLLPEPTRDQLIATAFHRNTPSNGEGGTHNEEYRVVSVLDRVNTTYEVWQGLTMACVQCHSHPYDPIKHEEYYQSYAFFNNTADHDHLFEKPVLGIAPAAVQAKIDSLSTWVDYHGTPEEVDGWRKALRTREPLIRPHFFEDVRGGVFTDRADEDFMVLRPGNSFLLPARALDDLAALHVILRVQRPTTVEVRLDAVDGELVTELDLTEPHGYRNEVFPLPELRGTHRLAFVVRPLEATAAPDRPLIDVYTIYPQPHLPGRGAAGYGAVAALVPEVATARDSIEIPILSENPPELGRATHVFDRGNWLVHAQAVRGGVPDILPPLETQDTNRLAFARWLVGPENPLTARVTVNRIWTELFGRGLVATPEDFGSQGAKPAQPELLDWLAVRFATDMGWSVKDLIREIVLSRTYRQSSDARPEIRDTDPYNDLLARGPRRRLTAEQLRDQMLAVSGLLSDKMYGPGVMPPQPEGLWDFIPYSDLKWETSAGEDRYRRAVYTYLRRSVLHPGMTTFDGSTREVCLSQRTETNTPLQALATLNDPAFLEGMQRLAEVTLAEEPSPARAIDRLHQRLLYRPIEEADRESLLALYEDALAENDGDRDAALFLVVNVLFNLDEFLTKS